MLLSNWQHVIPQLLRDLEVATASGPKSGLRGQWCMRDSRPPALDDPQARYLDPGLPVGVGVDAGGQYLSEIRDVNAPRGVWWGPIYRNPGMIHIGWHLATPYGSVFFRHEQLGQETLDEKAALTLALRFSQETTVQEAPDA